MRCLTLGVIALSLAAARADEPKFAPLLNGTDLSGWTTVTKDPKASADGTWSVLPGGVLKCTGKPTGCLITDNAYADYVLRLEWKHPSPDPKGHFGGVLLHVQDDRVFWPHSIEAQLTAGKAGDLWLQADAAGNFPKLVVDPARKDAANKQGRHFFRLDSPTPFEKPVGEWNRYEIRCTGGAIKLFINGQLANEATDGTLKRGRIGLQAEGTEVHFRNIELRPAK